MECLSLNKLFTYLQNPTQIRGRGRIDEHLSSGCPLCNQNLQWLEMVTTAAAEDRSFDFPEETIAAVVADFKARTAPHVLPIGQRIARLVFDSFLSPQLADVRSAATATAGRQVLYHTEGYHIDLRFELSDDNNDEQLIGQVLPERWDATELTQFKVQLLQGGSVVSATSTNAHGVFKIAPLVSGTYDLKVSVPDGEINLERVPTARS